MSPLIDIHLAFRCGGAAACIAGSRQPSRSPRFHARMDADGPADVRAALLSENAALKRALAEARQEAHALRQSEARCRAKVRIRTRRAARCAHRGRPAPQEDDMRKQSTRFRTMAQAQARELQQLQRQVRVGVAGAGFACAPLTAAAQLSRVSERKRELQREKDAQGAYLKKLEARVASGPRGKALADRNSSLREQLRQSQVRPAVPDLPQEVCRGAHSCGGATQVTVEQQKELIANQVCGGVGGGAHAHARAREHTRTHTHTHRSPFSPRPRKRSRSWRARWRSGRTSWAWRPRRGARRAARATAAAAICALGCCTS